MESLPKLTWHPAKDIAAPPSKPDGQTFDVTFVNRRESAVELFWMDREGKPKSYGQIAPGKRKSQQTRPGAIWQIAFPENGKALGHFEVGDRKARAVIPDE